MNKIFLIQILLFLSSAVFAQSAHKNLRNGDMLYGFGKFADAEIEYRKAETNKPSTKSTYNLGNSLMQQERYEEAAKKYNDAASRATTDEERAKVHYNQGNALYKQKQFKESIDAYKKSLRYNSSDEYAKENLAIARRELKKQQQEQQKDQKKEQNKNQNKDQEQDKNKDQKDNPDDQKPPQNQDQNQPSDDENQSPSNNKKMSREDAKKLLEIMDNEEKNVQQKLRRMDGKSKKVTKDW